MEQYCPMSTFVSYQGKDNVKRLRKFLKAVEKNMNNSSNIDSSLDVNRKSEGYAFRFIAINNIKTQFTPTTLNANHNYYIRFYINMYNAKTKKFYGNTMRSPNIKVEFEEDGTVKINKPEPFSSYVLTPDKDNDNCIIQIVLIETDKDDVILEEYCEGWTIFQLRDPSNPDPNAHTTQEVPKKNTKILIGSPRDILFKAMKDLVEYKDATLDYVIVKYPQMEKIKFLVPDYVSLCVEEELPGLLLRYLPPSPTEDEIKTVAFDDIYLKNIEIEIDPDLETKLLECAQNYRYDKYKITQDEFNKVYIKERRLKCGIHNTWCFINSNGLENSITLSKNGTLLSNKGVLLVDRFYSDELSSCAVIIELNYTLTIPIEMGQKEETLSLPIGYSVFVPDRVSMENDYRSSHFITGPGMTIYGEYLWYKDEKLKLIKINFYLSKNKEPIDRRKIEDKKEVPIVNNDEKYKNLSRDYNEALLEKEKENEDLRKQIDFLKTQKNVPESVPIIKPIQPDSEFRAESKINEEEKPKENNQEKSNEEEQQQKEIYSSTTNIEKTYVTNVHFKQENRLNMSQEDYDDFMKFQEFKKKNELFKSTETMTKLMEEQKEKSKIKYEQSARDIPKRDRADYLAKGILSLNIDEVSPSLVQYTLNKELSNENVGSLITFHFLAYKPRRDIKNISLLPNKIQFEFSFWTHWNLQSPICIVSRPETDIKYTNSPLALIREGSSIVSGEGEKEVYIQKKYDPSIETTDFSDFISYLLTKNMVIKIIDIDKCFVIGYIKVPLKDLIRGGMPQTIQTKEYDIYDDDFNLIGYIQMLLRNTELKPAKHFEYNQKLLKIIDTNEGYYKKSKKKKVRCKAIDVSKLPNEQKERLGQMMLEQQNPNAYRENQRQLKKFRLEPETEKKLRVMRYLNQKNELTTKMQNEELKYSTMRFKQKEEEKYFKNLSLVEKYREQNKALVLSKVTQENHKNEITISLIQGQPLYFNYVITNDSEIEQFYHIVINSHSDNQEEDDNDINDKTVSVINTPEEWSQVVELKELIVPNDYNSISTENYFSARANEKIPLVIKLLSFNSIKDKTYSLWINIKNDGAPIYLLSITIKQVYPIIDHIFAYYLPCNENQNLPLINPFKNNRTKAQNLISNYISSDPSVRLVLNSSTYEFTFEYTTKEEGKIEEFFIYFYTESSRSNLYTTWKFEIYAMNSVSFSPRLGSKMMKDLDMENNKEHSRNVQVFSSNNELVFIPEKYANPYIVKPNERISFKYIVYPKNKDSNKAILNCVDFSARKIIKSLLVNVHAEKPNINETQKVDCKIGNIMNFRYKFTNTMSKWNMINFDSNNERFLSVVDSKVGFNAGETKFINFSVPAQFVVGKTEVLVFAYDDEEVFSKTILFQLIFN